jgi:hypothetical protein
MPRVFAVASAVSRMMTERAGNVFFLDAGQREKIVDTSIRFGEGRSKEDRSA